MLKDWWGVKVANSGGDSGVIHGFSFATGYHPAYEQMKKGVFEPQETAVIQKLLVTTDTFIDVGANIGYYTCLALSRGVRVAAFEPQHLNLRILYRNILENGWSDLAEVFPVGLSYKTDLLTLYGASGPSASLIKGWADYSSRHRQVIPVSTMDRILDSSYEDQQLLVKVDVEGAEYQVLQGALNTIKRAKRPYWVIEICFDEYYPDGENPDFERIFELFWSHGYSAFALADSITEVTRDDVTLWLESRRCESGTYNYLFTDRDIANGYLEVSAGA
jgi:FkbM family methyltransferase